MSKILPSVVDNTFRGRKAALYFFWLITVMTVVRSCVHIFVHDGGAQSIATIPLDTYTDAGAAAVVLVFSYWGLSQLIVGVIQVVVALKYRSLIPLMYLMLVVEWGGRFVISLFGTIETTGQAPGEVGNRVLPVVCLAMFLLSINESKHKP